MTAKPSARIDRHANRVAQRAKPSHGSLLVALMLMALIGSAQAQSPAAAAPSAGASAATPVPDPRIDPGVTSLNILLSGKLTPTAAHPMAGFWKLACQDAFGLAIAPAGPGQYSVSFCGPGACYKPGTYAADTRLTDDPLYQVASANLLGVRGKDDKFTLHKRCTPGLAR